MIETITIPMFSLNITIFETIKTIIAFLLIIFQMGRNWPSSSSSSSNPFTSHQETSDIEIPIFLDPNSPIDVRATITPDNLEQTAELGVLPNTPIQNTQHPVMSESSTRISISNILNNQPSIQQLTQEARTQSSTPPSSVSQTSRLQPSEPSNRRNRRPAQVRNGRTRQMAEFLENDAELVQLLRNLTNQTSQITDPEAVEMSTAFLQMMKRVPAERRQNTFGKVQEVFANTYNHDEDVLKYGRALCNLLQLMDSSNRKETFNQLLRIINDRLGEY